MSKATRPPAHPRTMGDTSRSQSSKSLTRCASHAGSSKRSPREDKFQAGSRGGGGGNGCDCDGGSGDADGGGDVARGAG
eukprot:CAMPEP_0181171344 /NCGR_PEP_ID=MMETSP1096-20121128/1858_1 /TAXON_ID=156174 ORGANISM="Chrysochromulina ericina, Strain CCMP281" /NCGR_SAMPLE_ID=MMETSP1096 /ASSEMBLY_ACC=CAM_ASM_000453 /LENGTH=78 /DNA_ID=CAMNT_0023258983 /DNA_START=369 /DNA_END=605 /DNA_ORIENTATION=+